MPFRSFYLLAFFLISSLFVAQKDTIIVYEEVVIHDTIYVEDKKPEVLDLNKRIEENKRSRRITTVNWDFGINTIFGIKNANFIDDTASYQYGYGGGFWVHSRINNRYTFALEPNYFFWNSSKRIDANTGDSTLNGYYFIDSDEPILFQNFSNEHNEFSIPLKFYYDFNRISPFLGVYGTYLAYKMVFLAPANKVLDQMIEYRSQHYSYGFILGINYHINNFAFSFEFRQNKLDDLYFETDRYSPFKIDFPNNLLDRKFLFSIYYTFGDT